MANASGNVCPVPANLLVTDGPSGFGPGFTCGGALTANNAGAAAILAICARQKLLTRLRSRGPPDDPFDLVERVVLPVDR